MIYFEIAAWTYIAIVIPIIVIFIIAAILGCIQRSLRTPLDEMRHKRFMESIIPPPLSNRN